jgi:SAM-dependent methyltransferase
MSEPASSNGGASEGGSIGTPRYYKRDFWSKENLKFSEPWYRPEKIVRVITKLVDNRECTLLDVGCGPATLMRLLPPNIEYYGIDIAIQKPAPNLLETDILETPIKFGDRRFDLVVAQGVFEYVGEFQSRKFSEIAQLLTANGRFVVTYTNFAHRKAYIYPAFSNVQSFESFQQDLSHYFNVDRVLPVSYNWKHAHPSRKLLKAANKLINVNLPFVSRTFAVEYFIICSLRKVSTFSY